MTEETKETRIIRAKITTRKNQISNVGQIFSIFLVVAGFILLFFAPFIGVILFITGILISVYCSRKNRRLEDEIKELEAELD